MVDLNVRQHHKQLTEPEHVFGNRGQTANTGCFDGRRVSAESPDANDVVYGVFAMISERI